MFDLLCSPRLLDVIEQFIGPEIYSIPGQHTHVKIPETNMPDDSGVITADADDTEILTVWFLMTEATLDNGCLAVVPGSHRDGVALHGLGRNALTMNQVSIPDQLMTSDHVPLPMQPGDVLFMHRHTRHCGLPNMSDRI